MQEDSALDELTESSNGLPGQDGMPYHGACNHHPEDGPGKANGSDVPGSGYSGRIIWKTSNRVSESSPTGPAQRASS
jgi:hypothetical protein